MRIAHHVSPSPEDLQWLRKQAASVMVSKRLGERCRIVLQAAEGRTNEQIATTLKITRQKVARWRARFRERGCAGLEHDVPGRGRKPVYGPEITALIVERTTRSLPANATHWSQRSLAKALDVSDSTVGRVWRAHGLTATPGPHLQSLQRPTLRREAGGRGRPLPRRAGARDRALL